MAGALKRRSELDVRITPIYITCVAPELKSESFMIRMSKDERRMLRELASADGLSDAAVVRLLVRREHVKRFGEPPPKKKR